MHIKVRKYLLVQNLIKEINRMRFFNYWLFPDEAGVSDAEVEKYTRSVHHKQLCNANALTVVAGYVYAFVKTLGGLTFFRANADGEYLVPPDCIHEAQYLGDGQVGNGAISPTRAGAA